MKCQVREHVGLRFTPPVAAACLMLLGTAFPLQAQEPQAGRIEIGGGILRASSVDFDGPGAKATTPGGGEFTLFASGLTLDPAIGYEGRIGVRLTRLLQVEGSATYARPYLSARLASDVEGIPDVVVRDRLSQWTFGGALVAHLDRWRVGGRITPLLVAGASYLRELHSGRTLTDTGRRYYVGAGATIPFANREGALKALGLRVDVRALVRERGAGVDDNRRITAPAVGASFVARF